MELKQVEPSSVLALRTRQRQEMNCQIVGDSIHRRPGWTICYELETAGQAIGFGSIAIAGPWKDKPTLREFYLEPESRGDAFRLFEAFLTRSRPEYFELQSNDLLATTLAISFASTIQTESVVFQDHARTQLPSPGALLRQITPVEEILEAIRDRQGGGEWVLELEGAPIAKGGILFHYNRPYGDIYMEVEAAYRKRGFGAFLVQELKRECYKLGAVPAARCNPHNIASRGTLQKAGFAPCAHILVGRMNCPET
jgi:GNAT superfamily N-acetyltransferase